MKIGELDIKKAYFGAKEITPSNAYLGDVPIKKDEGIPNDEIQYTSSDGNIITPYDSGAVPTIVSNTYADGKGIIKFAKDVTSIGSYGFYGRSKLTSITIPNSIILLKGNSIALDYDLTSISYAGTISQWKAITKESRWNYNSSATVVHCTDGDVAI